MNLFLGKEELNYVLGIQEKGLSNRLGLKKKGGYPLWTAAFLTLLLVRCLFFTLTLTIIVIERNLTHTNVLWSYLNILVALDVLKTFLKTHLGLRDNACLLVRT